jgi:hypothetical protein
VREVAEVAALCLYRGVLVDKRTGNLSVAFHAYCISGDAAAQLLLLEGPMRIVTVAAAYEAFVYFVVEWLRESWLYVRVACVTELWLRNLE